MFKDKLREAREDKKITQSEIAKFLNMSSTGYGAYERGDTEPSIETLKKICIYLNVQSDLLLEIESKDNSLKKDLKTAIAILEKHIK